MVDAAGLTAVSDVVLGLVIAVPVLVVGGGVAVAPRPQHAYRLGSLSGKNEGRDCGTAPGRRRVGAHVVDAVREVGGNISQARPLHRVP